MTGNLFVRSGYSIALFVAVLAALRAEENAAALYKARCAGCHGASGEGKPSAKAPALKGATLDAEKIAQHIIKGEPNSKPPHKKGIPGVTEEQAKAIAAFIQTLK